jgi:hypothetical protein
LYKQYKKVLKPPPFWLAIWIQQCSFSDPWSFHILYETSSPIFWVQRWSSVYPNMCSDRICLRGSMLTKWSKITFFVCLLHDVKEFWLLKLGMLSKDVKGNIWCKMAPMRLSNEHFIYNFKILFYFYTCSVESGKAIPWSSLTHYLKIYWLGILLPLTIYYGIFFFSYLLWLSFVQQTFFFNMFSTGIGPGNNNNEWKSALALKTLSLNSEATESW